MYLGALNSEQTKTKIENQSVLQISYFLSVFLASIVNILKLGNSALKKEKLAKCDYPSTYGGNCPGVAVYFCVFHL